MRVGFVILHYQNIEDTKNCITSIKSLKADNIEISVFLIDNKSPNGSGKDLKKYYENDDITKVILMEKNYGFSYSNNVGYKYAKEDGCDPIIVCNNDVLFEDKFFLEELYNTYNNEDIDIIIPDVVNYNGFHQNPMKGKEYSFTSAFKNCFRRILIYVLLHIPILRKYIYRNEVKRETKWFKKYYENKDNNEVTPKYFVPIGAFIIYGRKWILNEIIAFPSNTFLYAEEYFLTHYIKKKEYIMKYCKNLKVKHLEGRSVEYSSQTDYQKIIKKYKYCIISLIKYMIFLIGGK